MLFPDYHSRFKDILTAESDDSTADAIAADSVAAQEPSEDCTQPHALRHLSDEQLSSLVACHARLLLSLAVRKRIALRRLSVHYAAPTAGDDVSNSLVPARVMAFGDSYRAAVLLAGPTASAPACVPRLVSRPDDVGKDANIRGKFLDLEAAFAPAHMLAISDAARMCKSGTTLLWDASATKMCADFTRKSMMRGTSVKEEGVSGRSYEFVDSHVDFHRDPNVRETRLTDRPLTALLRRAANLLEEFPGHGILIQVRMDLFVAAQDASSVANYIFRNAKYIFSRVLGRIIMTGGGGPFVCFAIRVSVGIRTLQFQSGFITRTRYWNVRSARCTRFWSRCTVLIFIYRNLLHTLLVYAPTTAS